MKPTAQRTERRIADGRLTGRKFPLIEFNYQVFSLDRFSGGSGDKPSRSFFDISRDYFQREAGRNFRAEVVFFLILAAILAGAFIQGARVIIHFLHLPPA
ncbi:MAG TPA: hypothetical protein VKS98_04595 [Chthoniobacterales bacterium]|nr:hypothetical protein [Chthoniobacterales bacterium]